MGDDETKFCIGGVLCFIAVLLICIMVPVSFSYVDRNKIAFKKNTATNDVDRSQVYSNGRYFWGLARSPVSFPSNYLKVDLTNSQGLTVFTDGGQSVNIDFVFWYRIDPAKLNDLYSAFGTSYHDRIVGIAKAELRNAAPSFTLSQYLNDRSNVSTLYFTKLQSQLQTKAFITLDASKFLLQHIQLPSTVLTQKLAIFRVDQEQKTALFNANATAARLETTRQVRVLENAAALVAQTATAQANRMRTDATSDSFGRVETERGAQLQNMITTLNVTGNATEQLILFTSLLDTGSYTLLSGVNGAILSSP